MSVLSSSHLSLPEYQEVKGGLEMTALLYMR